jgi:hypothetical protein
MNARDRRKIWGILALLPLVAVAALYWAALAQRPKGSNAEQIQALLARGERAVETRRVSEAIALISRSYRDDAGLRYASLRLLAQRQLSRAPSLEVTLPSRSLRIAVGPDGKHATAQAQVIVRGAEQVTGSDEIALHLTFELAKEPVRYYALFPGEEWRIVKSGGWQGTFGE